MGHSVVGLDNVNDYYNTQLKEDRLSILKRESGFKFVRMHLEDEAGIANLFRAENFSHVINLAAQAGMPYSLKNPKHLSKAMSWASSTSWKDVAIAASNT